MERRYSFDSDPGEHVPLDNHNQPYSSSSPSRHNRQHYTPQPSPPRQQQQQPQQARYYQDNTPSSYRDAERSTSRPAAHPNSDFARLREERRRSRGPETSTAGAGVSANTAYHSASDPSRGAPQPPPHRENSTRSGWSAGGRSNVTPGADNFGVAAAGGLAGIASTVADHNARQSGLDAMSGRDEYGQQAYGHQGYGQQGYNSQSYQSPQPQASSYDQSSYHYDQRHDQRYDQGYDAGHDREYDRSPGYQQDPYGAHGQYHDSSPSLAPIGAASIPSGLGTPARSQHSHVSDPFEDSRYAYGTRLDPRLGHVDPNDIMDDGDDGLQYSKRSNRNSMLSLGNSSNRGVPGTGAAAAGAAGGAAAGAAAGGLLGAQSHYAPVKGGGPSEYELANTGAKEQSQWAQKRSGSKKKWKWVAIAVIALVVAGAIVGGVIGGLGIGRLKGDSSSSGGGGGGLSATDDTTKNGDLDINSSEIKALLNNANLHKVFPGVDYTPINTQYPDCIKNPASQNNITRDVAVLSQLTNVIRLYGTDCNQTEMTIHALKQLKLDSTIKIWLGVWQDNNATTNARQLSQMWDILDQYGDKYFKGLIVANEILFRQQMTETELGTLLSSVRTNLTSKGMSLPVATSDLGDKWTSSLASQSDYIMSNIHPFFGGINAKQAASWSYSFWTNKNAGFMKSDASKNVIAEIGWPSQGGMDCGSETVTNCPDQSVAGIDEMNQLLNDWVCPALNNGTNYFWFEMFDEPWKIVFNTKNQNWEDHWGLMDVNRNLKSGVKIPDCGGKTVGSA